jgi:hypothetical protein
LVVVFLLIRIALGEVGDRLVEPIALTQVGGNGDRSSPGGAHPYSPPTISTSVPQMPTARASTTTEPSWASGSATLSSLADPAVAGTTVTANMAIS